jgi:N-acetyl-anhydromuramyl-L-alanine amidase AmpD
LVIHNISLPPAQFATGKVQEFFQNRLDVTEHPYFEGIADLRVSAHFLIERDGTSPSLSPVLSGPGMPACRVSRAGDL